MGNQCSGQLQACCTNEVRNSESQNQMNMLVDQQYHQKYRNQKFESTHLPGTSGVPSRLYSGIDVMKIVHLQACARRFLAQRLIKNVVENPSLYLRPTYSSQYSKYAANYTSQLVSDKLAEIGDFEWGDAQSEQLIRASGMTVNKQEEVTLPSKVKYTGEWNEDGKRHGRGTQIWPDGARYDGYFLDDH